MKPGLLIWTLAFVLCVGVLCVGALCVGCGEPRRASPPSADLETRSETPEQPQAAEPVAAQPDQPSEENPQSTPSVPPDAEKAVVGVTGKGQYDAGLITTPVAVYFSVRERVVFNVQIASAMKLFKASQGRYPKTHDEFMTKIIKQNLIRLPELPRGKEYFYDGKKAATMRNYDPTDPPIFVVKSP